MTRYRLSVPGPLSRPLLETITHRFGDVAVSRSGHDTVLDADLADTPSLRALLTLLWDAGHDVRDVSPTTRDGLQPRPARFDGTTRPRDAGEPS